MKKFFLVTTTVLGITNRNAVESETVQTLIDEHHPLGVKGNDNLTIVSGEINLKQLISSINFLKEMNDQTSRVDHHKLTAIEYVDEGRYVMHFQGVHDTSKRLQVYKPLSW